MKKFMLIVLAVTLTLSAFSLPSVMGSAQVRQAQAQGNTSEDEDVVVFQATGSTAASILGTVDAFRVALGDPNNGNAPRQPSGRREINWDGRSTTNLNTVSTVGSMLTNFQSTRGALFTTPGTGFVQAPASGSPLQLIKSWTT